MSTKNVFDLNSATLSLSGRRITDYTDGADCMQFLPIGDRFIRVSGNSRDIVIKTSARSVNLQIALLQNSDDSKYLQEEFLSQPDDIANHVPLEAFYRDNINGDTITAHQGWIMALPSFVRGNGHNPVTWVISFEREERKLG